MTAEVDEKLAWTQDSTAALVVVQQQLVVVQQQLAAERAAHEAAVEVMATQQIELDTSRRSLSNFRDQLAVVEQQRDEAIGDARTLRTDVLAIAAVLDATRSELSALRRAEAALIQPEPVASPQRDAVHESTAVVAETAVVESAPVVDADETPPAADEPTDAPAGWRPDELPLSSSPAQEFADLQQRTPEAENSASAVEDAATSPASTLNILPKTSAPRRSSLALRRR